MWKRQAYAIEIYIRSLNILLNKRNPWIIYYKYIFWCIQCCITTTTTKTLINLQPNHSFQIDTEQISKECWRPTSAFIMQYCNLNFINKLGVAGACRQRVQHMRIICIFANKQIRDIKQTIRQYTLICNGGLTFTQSLSHRQ